MKILINIVMIVSFLFLCSCGSTKTPLLNSSAKTNTAIGNTYSIESSTYTYTERYNNIVFKYPTLKGKSLEKSNKLIDDYIQNFFTEMYGPDYSDLDLTIDYSISFQDDTFISILFKGLGNVKTAAHPHDWFLTLNINVKNGTRVKLTDLYTINDHFKNIYFDVAKKQVPERFLENQEEWTMVLENIKKDVKLTNFNFEHADTYDGVQSYFTQNGLGLSMPVPFVMGDHFETVIPYSNIEADLKPDRPAESPVPDPQ